MRSILLLFPSPLIQAMLWVDLTEKFEVNATEPADPKLREKGEMQNPSSKCVGQQALSG
jgi:hypothetical protein